MERKRRGGNQGGNRDDNGSGNGGENSSGKRGDTGGRNGSGGGGNEHGGGRAGRTSDNSGQTRRGQGNQGNRGGSNPSQRSEHKESHGNTADESNDTSTPRARRVHFAETHGYINTASGLPGAITSMTVNHQNSPPVEVEDLVSAVVDTTTGEVADSCPMSGIEITHSEPYYHEDAYWGGNPEGRTIQRRRISQDTDELNNAYSNPSGYPTTSVPGQSAEQSWNSSETLYETATPVELSWNTSKMLEGSAAPVQPLGRSQYLPTPPTPRSSDSPQAPARAYYPTYSQPAPPIPPSSCLQQLTAGGYYSTSSQQATGLVDYSTYSQPPPPTPFSARYPERKRCSPQFYSNESQTPSRRSSQQHPGPYQPTKNPRYDPQPESLTPTLPDVQTFLQNFFTDLTIPGTRQNAAQALMTLHLTHLAYFFDNHAVNNTFLTPTTPPPGTISLSLASAQRGMNQMLAAQSQLNTYHGAPLRARLLEFAQRVSWKALAVCSYSATWRSMMFQFSPDLFGPNNVVNYQSNSPLFTPTMRPEERLMWDYWWRLLNDNWPTIQLVAAFHGIDWQQAFTTSKQEFDRQQAEIDGIDCIIDSKKGVRKPTGHMHEWFIPIDGVVTRIKITSTEPQNRLRVAARTSGTVLPQNIKDSCWSRESSLRDHKDPRLSNPKDPPCILCADKNGRHCDCNVHSLLESIGAPVVEVRAYPARNHHDETYFKTKDDDACRLGVRTLSMLEPRKILGEFVGELSVVPNNWQKPEWQTSIQFMKVQTMPLELQTKYEPGWNQGGGANQKTQTEDQKAYSDKYWSNKYDWDPDTNAWVEKSDQTEPVQTPVETLADTNDNFIMHFRSAYRERGGNEKNNNNKSNNNRNNNNNNNSNNSNKNQQGWLASYLSLDKSATKAQMAAFQAWTKKQKEEKEKSERTKPRGGKILIDATTYGNWTRFVRVSDDAEVANVRFTVATVGKLRRVLCQVKDRPIAWGAELVCARYEALNAFSPKGKKVN